MAVYEEIREQLSDLPVIDAHEHICDFRDCTPDIQPTEFLTDGWMSLVMEKAGEELDESERWPRFLEQWPKVRATAPGSILSHILETWDVGDDLDEGSYEKIRQRIAERSPESARAALREANIRGVLPHYLAHPSCGGLANLGDFFAGKLEFETGFFPF